MLIILYLIALLIPFFDDMWLPQKDLDVLSWMGYWSNN
ncbi:MAG: hypothetical protein Rpha_1771 [Candidatus Ruthia sp. Apha_13_S6]|nr:hypothetical protein [Candidatus Ruthia sp. Apha_13_S6]